MIIIEAEYDTNLLLFFFLDYSWWYSSVTLQSRIKAGGVRDWELSLGQFHIRLITTHYIISPLLIQILKTYKILFHFLGVKRVDISKVAAIL